jgi:hypothetical protein
VSAAIAIRQCTKHKRLLAMALAFGYVGVVTGIGDLSRRGCVSTACPYEGALTVPRFTTTCKFPQCEIPHTPTPLCGLAIVRPPCYACSMNANEMKNHEAYFNLYMDAGHSVADAFAFATADVRLDAQIEASITRLDFADAGIYGI